MGIKSKHLTMESLLEGVKLFDPLEKSEKPRFLISQGVTPVSGEAYGFSYEPDAFIPRKPWRTPTPQEADLMRLTDGGASFLENLAITKLPDSTIEKILALNISDSLSQTDIMEIKKRKPLDYLGVMDEIYAFKRRFLAEGDFTHKIGLIVNDSNRETVTVKDNKHVLGLHIDNWDVLSVDNLDAASNRICINLGREDRHFLVVNQTLATIYKWVTSKIPLEQPYRNGWMHTIVTNFFRLFPAYPVLKVRVSPFEAYIAPTETVIHDGCTDGNKTMDIDITTRGKFRLMPALTINP